MPITDPDEGMSRLPDDPEAGGKAESDEGLLRRGRGAAGRRSGRSEVRATERRRPRAEGGAVVPGLRSGKRACERRSDGGRRRSEGGWEGGRGPRKRKET